MLSLKCKINGVPLTWKLYKHQILIYFVPISTEETLTPYFTSVHTPLKATSYFYDSLFPLPGDELCQYSVLLEKSPENIASKPLPSAFISVAELHVS